MRAIFLVLNPIYISNKKLIIWYYLGNTQTNTFFIVKVLKTSSPRKKTFDKGAEAMLMIEYSSGTKQLDSYEIDKVMGTISKKVKYNQDDYIIAENTD